MSATSFLRRRLVDLLTGNAAYTPPALYLSLHTSDPGQSGSLATELAVGGYTRQSLAGKMGAADPVTGLSANTALITIGPATEPWPTVVFIGICDAPNAGHVLAPGVPSLPKTIAEGQAFQIPPGQLRLRLN